jgi:hypothetical protein
MEERGKYISLNGLHRAPGKVSLEVAVKDGRLRRPELWFLLDHYGPKELEIKQDLQG